MVVSIIWHRVLFAIVQIDSPCLPRHLSQQASRQGVRVCVCGQPTLGPTCTRRFFFLQHHRLVFPPPLFSSPTTTGEERKKTFVAGCGCGWGGGGEETGLQWVRLLDADAITKRTMEARRFLFFSGVLVVRLADRYSRFSCSCTNRHSTMAYDCARRLQPPLLWQTPLAWVPLLRLHAANACNQ